ncbi:MAG: hypothetical protein EKK40_00635 [Bradyrhizobiaceae bacterium]|nr:MAG: hypothetical protein EKK40_00635 [Bradyrhizobiaceae bacterium]
MQPVYKIQQTRRPQLIDNDEIAIFGVMPDFNLISSPAKRLVEHMRAIARNFSVKQTEPNRREDPALLKTDL